MLSDWVSFLAYPNLFGIKGFVVVVVVNYMLPNDLLKKKKMLVKCPTFGLGFW
jgi:hypothetical protein